MSPLAFSSADMQPNNHIPGGKKDYNRTIRAYFSKVTPAAALYQNIQADFQMTALYIDIFCDLPAAACAAAGLPALSRVEGADWYTASTLPYKPTTDGNTTLEAKGLGNASANINGNAGPLNQMFDGPAPDLPGDMTNINVSLPPGAPRPATINVSVEPDPWHVYDPESNEGFPHIEMEFIGASAWSGVGNTGQVVQTQSSSNAEKRLSW